MFETPALQAWVFRLGLRGCRLPIVRPHKLQGSLYPGCRACRACRALGRGAAAIASPRRQRSPGPGQLAASPTSRWRLFVVWRGLCWIGLSLLSSFNFPAAIDIHVWCYSTLKNVCISSECNLMWLSLNWTSYLSLMESMRLWLMLCIICVVCCCKNSSPITYFEREVTRNSSCSY